MYNVTQQHHDKYIKNGICPICNKNNIKSEIGNPAQDCYDFICNNCNPNCIISFSGTLLASDYYRIIKIDLKVKEHLKTSLAFFDGTSFSVNNNDINPISESHYTNLQDRQFNYNDWTNGDIYGDPDKYNWADKEDLLKVKNSQINILNKEVNKRLDKLQQGFTERNKTSFDSEFHKQNEINTVGELIDETNKFRNEIYYDEPGDDIELGDANYSYIKIKSIRSTYQKTLRGDRVYGILRNTSYSRKNPITDSLFLCQVETEALAKYFLWLKKTTTMITNTDTIEMKDSNREYEVCLSFAGEDRVFVEKVASKLIELEVKLFYDKYEEVTLWGKNLYQYLNDIYKNKSQLCVIFISKYYREKLWTNHELESAQTRAFKENKEYILPIKFDQTELPGLNETIGYLNANDFTPEIIAEMIYKKLRNASA